MFKKIIAIILAFHCTKSHAASEDVDYDSDNDSPARVVPYNDEYSTSVSNKNSEDVPTRFIRGHRPFPARTEGFKKPRSYQLNEPSRGSRPSDI